jgi:CRP-like cAMP-binding protein
LFAGLSRHQLLTILGSAKAVEFPRGSSIVTEGEKGKGFYVITKGMTKVTVTGNQVAELGEGSYFGEMAVIDGGPRAATITAETAVSTLELTPVALRRILDKEPAVGQTILEELRRRLEVAGYSVPASEEPASIAKLIDMSERLRAIEHPDWVRPASPKHRWLGLSSLFARGR